ncbi:MAG: protein-glutamate O-methyltransferase CheR [Vicinamibacterales bacterium]|nr:protein-glutamate O-methyltransferase CheR [Vicinamibacterales bacterium]
MASGAAAGLTLDASPVLSDRELAMIVALVYERAGIRLHDGKRELVTARLQKRLRHLGLGSYREYLHYLETDQSGEEMVAFLDAIATNHTYFFREEQHFAFLRERIVPALEAQPGRPAIDIWSAACSTGEEPFTLAMTLADVLKNGADGFTMLASDLSTKALATARSGTYKMERVKDLPLDVLRRHFERGMGQQQGLARVSASLRRRIEFAQLNLLEIGDLGRRFDVIFCRNVMIYFDRIVQQRVVTMLERHLRPNAYLFISHSESLNGISHGLKWVAPAVYQRRDA